VWTECQETVKAYSFWDFASCCVYNLNHYKYVPMQLLLLYNLSRLFFYLSVYVYFICPAMRYSSFHSIINSLSRLIKSRPKSRSKTTDPVYSSIIS
jgi:hypothetical protein